MRKLISRVLLLFIILGITSCTVNPQASGTVTESAKTVTAIPSADTEAPVTPTSTELPETRRTQYGLTAVLEYGDKRLDVQETIAYLNRSQSTMDELLLIVEPNLVDGVFELTALSWEDGSQIDDTALEAQRLTVPLRTALEPGETVHLRMTYSLYLPQKAGVLCFNDFQVNVSGWYPYVAPYLEGVGWISHDPAKVGEYQVYELADFQVQLRIEGAPAEFMLAASSKGTYEEGWYRFDQQNARNFTWSGSNEYKMLEAYAGEVRVRAFVFPYDLAAGQAALDTTVQAVNLFSTVYGSYEHDSLTIVEAAFGDGMEYDGLYYLGQEYFNSYEGYASSYLTTISAHETAHQWWYGMTANDQALEPWLDEALCTYSELIYYENYRPDLVNWWWQTRIDAFYPQGKVDLTIYDRQNFRLYVNAVYLRGASFLGELNETMGDEAFMIFLRDYFTEIHQRAESDQLGLATTKDFWRVLEMETDQDLSSLKEEYFSQP